MARLYRMERRKHARAERIFIAVFTLSLTFVVAVAGLSSAAFAASSVLDAQAGLSALTAGDSVRHSLATHNDPRIGLVTLFSILAVTAAMAGAAGRLRPSKWMGGEASERTEFMNGRHRGVSHAVQFQKVRRPRG